MILATLRAAGLAALTASALVGCNSAGVSNSEQPSADGGQGGGGSPSDDNSNTDPRVAALCVTTPGASSGYQGSVAAQVSDDEDQRFTFEVVEQPSHGSLQLDLNSGDFSYRPQTAERGYRDSFRYRVEDFNGGSAEGRVELVYGALRVMPLGDSITYGVTGYTSATGDRPSREYAVGYRQALYESLVGDGYLVDFVGDQQAGSGSGLADPDHQGIPGWTSWQIGDAVTGWLTANPADVVLAHIGTNDHKITTDGVNYTLNNINNWALNHNPVKTLLAAIVDQRPDTFFTDTVEDFNANLAQLLDASWPEVTLVDHHGALDNQADMTPLAQDSVGLHPNDSGYAKMAAVWEQALRDSGRLHKCP